MVWIMHLLLLPALFGICKAACEGGVFVESSPRFSGCVTLTGNLQISGNVSETVQSALFSDLAFLETVNGRVYISGVERNAMSSLDFLTSLRFVKGTGFGASGIHVRQCNGLINATLPVLEEVWGEFVVENNPSLVGLSAPAFSVSSGSYVSITNNDALTFVLFPQLPGISGGLTVTSNALLSEFSAPVLNQFTGSCVFDANPALNLANVTMPSVLLDRCFLCASMPCTNGGHCNEMAVGFTCVCPVGTTGQLCETTNTDECASTPCSDRFISTWDTARNAGGASSNSDEVRLPLHLDGTYNFMVNWGDGSSNTITSSSSALHIYSSAGQYNITITGVVSGWNFDESDSEDTKKLLAVIQWGTLHLGTGRRHFAGCSNMDVSATDAPDLSGMTSLEGLFQGCSSLTTPDLSAWNISGITNLASTFRDTALFNGNISAWDTNSVLSMESMFHFALKFNGAIGMWDVRRVQNMVSMFRSAFAFNQNLSLWCTGIAAVPGDFASSASAWVLPQPTWNQGCFPCDSSPCRNGGVCMEGSDSFTCVCTAGFTGVDCGAIQTACVGTFRSTLSFMQPLCYWSLDAADGGLVIASGTSAMIVGTAVASGRSDAPRLSTAFQGINASNSWFRFDATTNSVLVSLTSPKGAVGSTLGSVCHWVRPENSSSSVLYYGSSGLGTGFGATPGAQELHTFVNKTSEAGYRFGLFVSGLAIQVQSSERPFDNAWHFVCATWNRTGVATVHVDGGSARSGGESVSESMSGADAFVFSSKHRVAKPSSNVHRFLGSLDELSIFDRALRGDEVAVLHQAAATACAGECASNPCENGGTCNNDTNSFTCSCVPGFNDPSCSTNTNECASNPCENGGTCNDGTNSYSCSCVPGFNDSSCSTNIDECASNPCENGGTCNDGTNSFVCTCAPGFNDSSCSTNTDECASNPCENGGTCNDGTNSYTCACFPGYNGTVCSVNFDKCASSPCSNGGTCTDATNGSTCTCAPGFFGVLCETPVLDCAHGLLGANCTQPGIIVGPAGGSLVFGSLTIVVPASAVAANGTVVRVGTLDTAAARPLPSNAVKAQSSIFSLIVSSLNGGEFARAIEVHIARDANATTGGALVYIAAPFDNPSAWALADAPFTAGRRRLSSCVPMAGGACGTTTASSAQLALLAFNECSSSPCSNGGTCFDSLDSFVCECPAGRTGTVCESDVDECASSPCQNGGTCTEDDTDPRRFDCTCITEVSGSLCESDCRVQATVTTQARVDAYAGCTRILGPLHLLGTGVRSLASLSSLQQLYGALTINATSVESVHLPVLLHVHGDLLVADTAATRVVDLIAPQLERIDGSLRVESLPSFIALDLARLLNVTGDTRLGNNPQLCVSVFVNPAAFTTGTVDTAGSGGSALVSCLLNALTLRANTTSGSVAAAAAASVPLVQLTANNTWLADENTTAAAAAIIVSTLTSILDSLVSKDTAGNTSDPWANGALSSSFTVLGNLLEPTSIATLRTTNQNVTVDSLLDQFVGAASSRVVCDTSLQFSLPRLVAHIARQQNASQVEREYTGLNETLVVPRGLLTHLGLNESCVLTRLLVSATDPYVSSDGTQQGKVDSNVVRFSLANATVTNLPEELGIDVTLYHHNTSRLDNRVCVQWNRWTHVWSTHGCRAIFRKASKTVCRCQQLDPQTVSAVTPGVRCRTCRYMTSFAILAGWNSPVESQLTETDAVVLSVLSYFGCVLSMIASVFICLSYAVFKRVRTLPIAMIVNLAIALFAVNFIFLAGITKTANATSCRAVGILLYFSLMASFAWMACIAHNLYFMLVKVFGQGRSLRFYSSLGWGCAAGATIVIVIADVASDGGVQFGGANHCWIHSRIGLLVGFLVPVGAVLVYNLVVTGIVFYQIVRKSRASAAATNDRSKLRVFFGIVSCLGLTWVFAYLAIATHQVALWYLFVIFNTMQGALLALLFMLSGRTRKEWKEKLAKVRRLFSSNQTETTALRRGTDECTPTGSEADHEMNMAGGMYAGLRSTKSDSSGMHPHLLGRKRSIQLLSFSESSMREPSLDAVEGEEEPGVDYHLVDKDEDEGDGSEGYGYMGAVSSNTAGSYYQGTFYGNSEGTGYAPTSLASEYGNVDGTGYAPASLANEYGNRDRAAEVEEVYGNRAGDATEYGEAAAAAAASSGEGFVDNVIKRMEGVARKQLSEQVQRMVKSLSLKSKTREKLAMEQARHKAVFEAMPKPANLADDDGDYDDERHSMDALMVESQFERSRLKFEEEIGKGNFGFVVLASTESDVVAVKTLNANASPRDRDDFVQEAQLLADVGVRHVGIVKLLGVCMDREPWLMVTELAMYGDLRSFVRRTITQRHRLEVSPTDLVRMAVQVAAAMGFLADNGVLHRDLAARNCLLYANNVVKVSDFGLAVRLERGIDRYKIPRGSQLPMRWMPVEALTDGVFWREKSDVWSFGVLVWELFTFGKVRPYRDVPINGIVPFVQTGRRLDIPYGCPKSAFSIIKSCWCGQASDRPTFAEVEDRLRALVVSQTPVRDLGVALLEIEQRLMVVMDGKAGAMTV